jgi:hypothetical protein
MPDERDARDGQPSPDGPPAEASAEGTSTEADEGLRDYWKDVLGTPPETTEARLVRELGIPHPGTLTFATSSGKVIVKIDPNGKVTLGEGVTADEAAEEFWTAMSLKRQAMGERLMQLGAMEAMLHRCARADIAYERAATRAREPLATEEDRFREELQRRNLEAAVHQMIEFSRGLLLPATPPPAEPHLH